MKKRVFSVIIALCLMLGVMPFTVFAEDITLSGNGTVNDPYLISSEAEFQKFIDIVNGTNGMVQNTAACGKVIESFRLYGTYTPIGSLSSPYTGTFVSEKGKCIIGLVSKNKGFCQLGLFGCIENAVIENVTVTESNYRGIKDIGIIAGYAKNSVIKNCSVSTNYYGVAGEESVGGIVGRSEDSKIINCTSSAKVQLLVTENSAKHKVGGIVGVATLSENVKSADDAILIEDCANSGLVACISEDDFECTGGIVGRLVSYNENYRATVKNCTNYASGSVMSIEAGTGGIVGYARNAKITGCNNHAEVKGTYAVGGIAGYALYGSEIINCNNYGNVTGEDYKSRTGDKVVYSQYVGGIVGSLYNPRGTTLRDECGYEEIEPIHKDSLISNCDNEGNVTCNTEAVYEAQQMVYNPIDNSPYALSISGAYTGGIIGSAVDSAYFSEEGNKIVIKDCTNIGTVKGPDDENAAIGGLAGVLKNVTLSNCTNTGNVLYAADNENDSIRDDIGICCYTVVFNADGIDGYPTVNVALNGKLNSTPTPVKDNCDFKGWFDNKVGGVKVTDETVFTERTELYAQWLGEENGNVNGDSSWEVMLELIIDLLVLVGKLIRFVCNG